MRLPDGDPLYDLADLMDLHEALIVRGENERRAHRAAAKS